ncbi:MAG: hypothetical protein NXH88_10100 [Hyphomonas sp.]|nr:hypothetical protein [Hyphomonas sp.]
MILHEVPQRIKEAYVTNSELAEGGRSVGRMAELEIARLLNEWPTLGHMTPEEFEAIALDLESKS